MNIQVYAKTTAMEHLIKRNNTMFNMKEMINIGCHSLSTLFIF